MADSKTLEAVVEPVYEDWCVMLGETSIASSHYREEMEALARKINEALSPILTTAQAERDRAREALTSLVNLACGVGQRGGKPESGEIEDAIETAKAVLDAKALSGEGV